MEPLSRASSGEYRRWGLLQFTYHRLDADVQRVNDQTRDSVTGPFLSNPSGKIQPKAG